MVRDRLNASNSTNLKLRIIGKRGKDGRRYNLPTASEIAALIVGDFDVGTSNKDVIVETQGGYLQRLSVVSSAYLPLQYPLLFPRGEDGLSYVRTHQKELRAELYKGLVDAILRGETEPATVGKHVILPSSFTGGAHYMFQNYQDVMGICRWAGYPDLFITFTCNQMWHELQRTLRKDGLHSEDRPDLICRLFKIKLDQMIKEIKQGNVFGKVKAVVYTVEFQKRGLPHSHILIWMYPEFKYPHPNDINKIIYAEIPDQSSEPELFRIVQSLMIHAPCGIHNSKPPCMQNGKCIRHFPKRFLERTTFNSEGYPLYRRRDNGSVVKRGDIQLDNRFIVPYNKHFLLKYNAHINVEWCNQSRTIKYLFKYINKGHDCMIASFYESARENGDSQCVDEIKIYYDCRYLSSYEAAWRILAYGIHYREPAVERFSFHFQDEQCVFFNDEESIDYVLSKPSANKSKFLAWLEANKKFPEAKTLTFAQFPMKFV